MPTHLLGSLRKYGWGVTYSTGYWKTTVSLKIPGLRDTLDNSPQVRESPLLSSHYALADSRRRSLASLVNLRNFPRLGKLPVYCLSLKEPPSRAECSDLGETARHWVFLTFLWALESSELPPSLWDRMFRLSGNNFITCTCQEIYPLSTLTASSRCIAYCPSYCGQRTQKSRIGHPYQHSTKGVMNCLD